MGKVVQMNTSSSAAVDSCDKCPACSQARANEAIIADTDLEQFVAMRAELIRVKTDLKLVLETAMLVLSPDQLHRLTSAVSDGLIARKTLLPSVLASLDSVLSRLH